MAQAEHTISVGDRVGYRQDRGGHIITGTVQEIVPIGWVDGHGRTVPIHDQAWVAWDDAMPLVGCWMACAQLHTLDADA